jgi:hypothetical protein
MKMGRRWKEDGKKMERRWKEDGKKMGRRWEEDGMKMERRDGKKMEEQLLPGPPLRTVW